MLAQFLALLLMILFLKMAVLAKENEHRGPRFDMFMGFFLGLSLLMVLCFWGAR